MKSSKIIKAALMAAIAFITYNIILFTICGFEFHGGAFWSSYIFMLASFGCLAACGSLINKRSFVPRDFMFGYPIIKHSIIYIITEFICSVLFMALDGIGCPTAAAFSIQLIIFAFHLIILISCFLAKETIEQVEKKAKNHVSSMRLLQTDAEMISQKATNEKIKTEFKKLAEKIRFSDPMGNPSLSGIEEAIGREIKDAEYFAENGNIDEALKCSKKAFLLLEERNKKCMALK